MLPTANSILGLGYYVVMLTEDAAFTAFTVDNAAGARTKPKPFLGRLQNSLWSENTLLVYPVRTAKPQNNLCILDEVHCCINDLLEKYNRFTDTGRDTLLYC